MKKAIVIGGRGKVGGFLVPMLVHEGFHVINVSRGKTQPLVQDDAWQSVEQLTLDRKSADFEKQIARVGADVVIDMICFQNADMLALIDAMKDAVGHYLVCGSAWIHGAPSAVPVLEEECRQPLEDYGVQKSLMDRTLAARSRESGFPGTAVHPGHIVTPGSVPINPQGFAGLSAFRTLKAGGPLWLPNFGLETMHHVHAADVAGVFVAAIKAGKPSFGEGFHAVSPRAVTFRGYAAEVASWYGQQADLHFEPFEQWKLRVKDEPQAAETTHTHLVHSPSCSMRKAENLLGFTPRYTSYEAVRESVASFGL